jgi:hypothetical protein
MIIIIPIYDVNNNNNYSNVIKNPNLVPLIQPLKSIKGNSKSSAPNHEQEAHTQCWQHAILPVVVDETEVKIATRPSYFARFTRFLSAWWAQRQPLIKRLRVETITKIYWRLRDWIGRCVVGPTLNTRTQCQTHLSDGVLDLKRTNHSTAVKR